MNTYLRAAIPFLFFLVAGGIAHAASTAKDTAPRRSSAATSLSADFIDTPPPVVADLPNVSCKQAKKGWNQECASDDWRIEVDARGCRAKNGAYGKVYIVDGEAAVMLRRSLSPAQPDVEAKLKDGQFVCVAATARGSAGNEPQWYYVMAIPVRSVKACAAKSFCAKPGDLLIERVRPPSGQRCQPNARGRYEGDCAAGWVKAKEFGEFSMGL